MSGSTFNLHMGPGFTIKVIKEEEMTLEEFIRFIERHKWYMGYGDTAIQVSQIKAIEKIK